MGFKLKDFPQHVQDQVRGKESSSLDVCKGKQAIFVNKLPPGLNGSEGLMQLHWTKYQKLKKKWVEYIRRLSPERHVGMVDIRYTRVSVRMMDYDNIAASFKVLGDALEDLDVITDDSPRTIGDLKIRWEKADTLRSQGVRIEIETITQISEN